MRDGRGMTLTLIAAACRGPCDTYSWDHEYIDVDTCRALEAGADCMPVCEAAYPGVEYQSCNLDNRHDCEGAWVECETTDAACK